MRNSPELEPDDELEFHLHTALRREAAPPSLAAGVESRLEGRLHVMTAPHRSPAEPHLLSEVVDQPVWQSIFENLRGLFRKEELPPLVLTSTPVAVIDPFQVRRNPASSAISAAVHVLVIGLIAYIIIQTQLHPQPKPPQQVAAVDISAFRPIAPKPEVSGGGGGGGARELVPAPRGKLPKIDPNPITPPLITKNDHPKLAVEPAINLPKDIQVANNNLPNLGDPRTSVVGPASNGTGSGAGLGSGSGGGIGSGAGNGYGPGQGGGTGGGLYHVGGGVSPPVLISSVDAEFSDEARRAKYQGVSVVSLIVDARGNPQRIRVIRKLGMGLDEKAVEAVQQYKFRPSMLGGKPVPVEITIEVNFHIY